MQFNVIDILFSGTSDNSDLSHWRSPDVIPALVKEIESFLDTPLPWAHNLAPYLHCLSLWCLFWGLFLHMFI